MKLAEILKDSNYSLTQFTHEETMLLEKSIFACLQYAAKISETKQVVQIS